MIHSALYPLRTIVGDSLPYFYIPEGSFLSVSKLKQFGDDVKHQFQHLATDAQIPEIFEAYFPRVVTSGADYRYGEGSFELPPANLPFATQGNRICLHGLGDPTADPTLGRRYSVEYLIKLSKPQLVGGVAFCGMPFIPYRVNKFGENSANFGLPREIRLTCLGRSADDVATSLDMDFLDQDLSTVRQEIISHSHFHYLEVDPCHTQFLHLRLADFPYFLTHVDQTTGRRVFRYGYLLPHFYVFEYSEGTRYRSEVECGLLATLPHSQENTLQQPFSSTETDYLQIQPSDRYSQMFDFSAASLFSPGRRYSAGYGKEYSEMFISDPMQPGQGCVLVAEQAQDQNRCIAGLRALLPFVPDTGVDQDLSQLQSYLGELTTPQSDSLFDTLAELSKEQLEHLLLKFVLKIPLDIDLCERVRIEVFELDPPAGIPPIHLNPEGKYAYRLADLTLSSWLEMVRTAYLQGIRFERPTLARYLAMRLTNIDDKPGQFAVKQLQFKQSAHLAVAPRQSARTAVRKLHYRLVGADLLEDYARLGSNGFNFQVERVAPGRPKTVLFKANSLLDLLQSGGARVLQNSRRRAVEFEKTTIYSNDNKNASPCNQYVGVFPEENCENFEMRKAVVGRRSLSSSKTGSGVTFTNAKGNVLTPEESFSTTETRSHLEHIYPHGQEEFSAAGLYLNTGHGVVRGLWNLADQVYGWDLSDMLVPVAPNNLLSHQFFPYWRGLTPPAVTGMKTVSFSPFSPVPVGAQGITDLINGVSTVLSMATGAQPPNPAAFWQALRDASGGAQVAGGVLGFNTGLLGLLIMNAFNGFNLGVSGSIYVGASTSSAHFLPGVLYNHSYGSQGTIQKSASRTAYSQASQVNESEDVSEQNSSVRDGENKRIVERKAVPGTDDRRVRGAETMWQGELRDIVVGSLPLNVAFPATADHEYRGSPHQLLKVRLGGDLSADVQVDIWFEVEEEALDDDY